MPAAIAKACARCSRRWRCAAPSRAGDLNYLANLCHQCGACYPDCQYSPPHEFNVNVPAGAGEAAQRELRAITPGRAPSPARSRATASLVTLLTAASVAGFHHRLRRLGRSGRAVLAQCRRLLQSDAAQCDGGGVRRRRSLRDRRVLVLACAPSGATSMATRRRRPRRLRAGGRRHDAPDLSARRRWRLHQRDRGAVAGAPHLSPLHLLRLPVLLRRHLGRDDLSLRLRLARALRAHQPAGRARHYRRSRPARRPGRPVPAVAQARSRSDRRRAHRHEHRLHRHAVPDQPHRLCADGCCATPARWACCSPCISAWCSGCS